MNSTTKLINLCLKNDVDGVRKCLKENVDVNKSNIYGHTPLMIAADSDAYEIAQMLIKAGADVNCCTPLQGGHCPLAYAACTKSNNKSMIKLLYEAGADINVVDDSTSPLTAAALNNCFDNMNYLIELGADVNLQDQNGSTTLMLLSQFDRIDSAKILIENGADVNLKDNKGMTVLMYACYYGNIKYAKFLIENGAKINIQDNIGNTALTYAKSRKQELSKVLLKYGVK